MVAEGDSRATSSPLWLERLSQGCATSLQRVCVVYKRTKARNRKCSSLPTKEPEVTPWHALCTNPHSLARSWQEEVLASLPVVDPATGWFEVAEVPSRRANCCTANYLEVQWLTCCPQPAVRGQGKRGLSCNQEGQARRNQETDCCPQPTGLGRCGAHMPGHPQHDSHYRSQGQDRGGTPKPAKATRQKSSFLPTALSKGFLHS